ncbi:MAG: polysaccharide biosynthesis C-terminal domain-containing protein, partial [Actinomycetes bacterium]
MVPSAWIGNVSVPVLRLLIVPIALSLGAGGVALAIAWGLPLALGALASAVVLARLLGNPSRVGPGVTRRLAGEFWRFASPRGLAGVFQVTVMWLDVLLVGALLSSQKAGIYTVASRYAVIGTLGLSAAGSAIAPQISRLFAQHRHTEAQDLFRSSTLWIVALAWPVLLIMAVFAPALMGAFGHGFSSGAGALSVLAGAMLWLTGTGNSGIALLMTGRSWYTFAITALSVSVNIGLNLVLIPRLGIVGAAWAWAATIVVANGLTVAALAWVSGISPFGTGYYAVGGAALALFGGGGLIARLLVGPRLPVMIWYTAAASAAYA